MALQEWSNCYMLSKRKITSRGQWPTIGDGASVSPILSGFTSTGANVPTGGEAHAISLPSNGIKNFQKFEVRSGDVWSGDVGNSKERAELYTNATKFSFNQDYWGAWSFNLDFGDDITGNSLFIIGQFHQTPDAGDATISPMFDVSLATSSASTLQVRTRTSQVDPIVASPTPTTHYTTPIDRFTWHDVVMRINFDPADPGTGLLDFYLNGTQVVAYTGPIGYVDAVGPYFKWGIYSGTASYTRKVKYANMQWGTASLASVVASPEAIVEDPY